MRWVVTRIAESFSCFTMRISCRRDTGSTPVVGSSRNSARGHTMRVKATHSFLLLPPLKVPALVLVNSVSSRVSMISFLFLSLSSPLRPFIRATRFRLSSTVSYSQRALCCGHRPMYGPSWSTSISTTLLFKTLASPDVLGVSRHIMPNVVDLPAPLGPRRPKTSPFLTANVLPATA